MSNAEIPTTKSTWQYMNNFTVSDLITVKTNLNSRKN